LLASETGDIDIFGSDTQQNSLHVSITALYISQPGNEKVRGGVRNQNCGMNTKKLWVEVSLNKIWCAELNKN
jgi:hypothetical protein